ncbi:MAG: hypothetical protein HON92_09175 [Planctomycetaceae bacterium]|nr:hypothetical protein [Planctomycetaceae bacterium]
MRQHCLHPFHPPTPSHTPQTGGMDADNVAAAITVACPTAVDVASGVESSPGKKDAELVRRFVASAIAAFDSLS